jgi:hypothetical protein
VLAKNPVYNTFNISLRTKAVKKTKIVEEFKAVEAIRLLRDSQGQTESRATRAVICSDSITTRSESTSCITCRTRPLPPEVTMGHVPT